MNTHQNKPLHPAKVSHSKLERQFSKIMAPLESFAKNQTAASVLLLICTVIALFLASFSDTKEYYFNLINTRFGLHLGTNYFSASLQFWINDILLALFFFIIGLEIKREFLIGELAHPKKIALTVATALGGMLIPASIYYLFTHGTAYAHAWGIPMATDTAFCLGILSLFRNKLPKGLITFMVAVAIFDDIGAITVIATIYTSTFVPTYFIITLGLIALLCVVNLAGIRKPLPYLLIGICVWISTELSGVHGTLAGLLVAFTIPARAEFNKQDILSDAHSLLSRIKERNKAKTILEDDEQHHDLQIMQKIALYGMTPLQHWGNALEKPVNLLILPLFALTNAGINIDFNSITQALSSPITWGVASGLILGKFLGITLACFLLNRFANFPLPKDVNNRHIIGIGLLAGIGFTMSIFIADLSFSNLFEPLVYAKAGILLASLLAAILAILWFKFTPAVKTAD